MAETEQQVASSMQMDDFCLDVALVLRRILDLDPAPDANEGNRAEASLLVGASEGEGR